MQPTDGIAASRDGEYQWLVWSESGYSGGGDPDPDPEPEPIDIDVAEWARAFGAGFFLVAMFWGLGKGIALILQQVRRG